VNLPKPKAEKKAKEKHEAPAALVTAGARRLGRSIAIKLAELGFDIALHYRASKEDAMVAAREVEARGRRCALFHRNFDHFDEVLTLIPAVRQEMPNLTLLVNNASVFDLDELINSHPEEFDANFNVHVKAPYFLIRDFARHCGHGQIINIVDTQAVRYETGHFAYLLSKKTLLELTRMAAKQLAPAIRVNAIAPGIVLPPLDERQRTEYERLLTANPLKRCASPEDVMYALDYLIKCEQITGETLFVDGGDHINF
jgi:NAD(P)-dependent dehydrogenase (short-subunit alcohol dehydrogenase family)